MFFGLNMVLVQSFGSKHALLLGVKELVAKNKACLKQWWPGYAYFKWYLQ